MSGKHCQSCRCTQMQDKPWLSMTDEGAPYMGSLIPPDLERSSFPRHLTGGHWLGRASCSEVIDVDLNKSLGLGKSRFQHGTPSISSMGNLVCSTSTVSALQQCELSETEFANHDTLSQNGLHSYMNQVPGRDGHLHDISEDLASINQGEIQPYFSTGIIDPDTWLLENNGPGHSALNGQALAIGNPSILPYKANQPPTNLSGSLDDGGFFDAFLAAQISSPIDLGSTAGHGNVSWVPGHSSSFPEMSETQPITGLQSLTGPTLNDGTSHLPGQFIIPPLPTNSLDWTTGSQFSIDTPLIPTTAQRETFITGTHVTSPPPDHSTPRARGRRPFRCPHEDCDYTSNSQRDVQRHRGSRKHGESPKSFPCLEVGCNFPKDNPRRDNYIRHMETVHYQIIGRMKNGRRPNRTTQEEV